MKAGNEGIAARCLKGTYFFPTYFQMFFYCADLRGLSVLKQFCFISSTHTSDSTLVKSVTCLIFKCPSPNTESNQCPF